MLPADWTAVEVSGNGAADATWFHTTVGPTGAFAVDPLTSTTSANGWMIFDSDLNCSGDQDAWLISPEIDATDKAAVWLIFETYYRNFYDQGLIRVGTDMNDLSSWAMIEAFPGVGANDFGGLIDGAGDGTLNPQTRDIDISEYAAGQTFRFAFQFWSTTENITNGLQGCAYAWQVDDVQLTDQDPRPAIDLQVNQFHAVAPNAYTPVSQVEPIGFISYIANVGGDTVSSATLEMEVINEDGAVMYLDSVIYTNIAPDSTAENVFFGTEFDVPEEVKVYQGTYSISTPDGDDGTPFNNEASFIFAVTDSLFSKDNGATRSIAPADDDNYTYGNVYYVENGDGMYARYVSWGLVNADELVGNAVSILLYEWDGDTNGDGYMNLAEVTSNSPIAFNSYIIQGDEDTSPLTMPIDLDNNAIPLSDDKYYVIVVQYVQQADETFFMLASDDYDYAAMNFYTDSLERPRYAGLLDVGNSGDIWTIGFGMDIVPVVRMSIGNNPDIYGDAIVSTSEPLLAANTVTAFPVPADKFTNIEMNFDEVANNVSLELFDLQGKLIRRNTLDNVSQYTMNYPTADLQNGTYMIRVRTENGIRTIQLNVQH